VKSEEPKDSPKEEVADLIEPEENINKGVGIRDYMNLMRYGSGTCGALLFLLTCVLTALAQLWTSFALA